MSKVLTKTVALNALDIRLLVRTRWVDSFLGLRVM
jgi:hypothetical protein